MKIVCQKVTECAFRYDITKEMKGKGDELFCLSILKTKV